MIYIKLEGHEFINEIKEIAKLFYINEEFILCEECPPAQNGGIFIWSRLFHEENGWELYIEYRAEGYNAKARSPVVFNNKDGEREFKKAVKKQLKSQLYVLLSKLFKKELPWGILTGIRPSKIVYEMMEAGKDEGEIIKEMKAGYLVSKEKAQLTYSVAKSEEAILKKSSSDTVSLYIGIPFCTTRCLYCSFTSNSIIKYGNMVESYLDALKTEIKGVNEIIKANRYKIQSIYIGGGTPTSLKTSSLEGLLDSIENVFDLDALEEYTLEAGRPDTLSEEKLRAIKNSRVDRISINPQTMNDNTLKLIGRAHSSEDIERTFSLARQLSYGNINMDVIVGLPGENVKMFNNTMDKIQQLGPESVTVHTMAVKRASRLNEGKEKYIFTSGEEASTMVEKAYEYANSMGMHPYYLYRQKNILGNLENVGYCRPGFESIYNIQIMEERQTIIALGAGAVTKVVYPAENRIERAFNVKDVEGYILRLEEMLERKRELMNVKS